MYRAAYRITRNVVDADDAVGAACIKLVTAVDRLRCVHPEAQGAYLLTMVKNEALMLLRRRKVGDHALERIEDWESGVRDVEAGILYDCTLNEIMTALRSLPQEERVLLQMKFFDRLPDKEIARFFHVGSSTIRSRISRARKRLRAKLKEYEDDE